MRVYIAGPMTGLPDMNRAAFAQRAQELIDMGHEPINPVDVLPDHPAELACIGGRSDNEGTEHEYGCYLRADILALLVCDAITLLDGWERSKGASTEAHVAQSIGLPVLEFVTLGGTA